MAYKEKKEELEAKYEDVIKVIAKNENVDMGIAFDMFVANIEQGYMYGWREAKADFEALENEAKTALGN